MIINLKLLMELKVINMTNVNVDKVTNLENTRFLILGEVFPNNFMRLCESVMTMFIKQNLEVPWYNLEQVHYIVDMIYKQIR